MQYGKDGNIFPEQSCSFDNKTSHRFMISYIGLWFLENYEIFIGQKCNFDFIFQLNNPQTCSKTLPHPSSVSLNLYTNGISHMLIDVLVNFGPVFFCFIQGKVLITGLMGIFSQMSKQVLLEKIDKLYFETILLDQF